MALTDSSESLVPALPPAPQSLTQPASRGLPASARSALGRLPEIHAEAGETATLARFLRSAVPASASLILCGALALVLAGAAGLQQEFAWSLLVLIGVGAMLRSYIKSTAQAFDRAPLRESAKDLRAIFFYAGFAWGAGAFLLLGNNPVPLTGLCFAVLPSVFLLPLVKDRAAALGFVAPVTILTSAAIILEPWGDAPMALALLLALEGSLMAALALSGRRRMVLPAGLSLR
jgi:hypothetical protein